jgi:exopolysaccharide production protein ExoZ
MRRERLGNVQILRFIAAGAVLITHTLDVMVPQPLPVRGIPWGGGVDIFFVISGFIMAWLTAGRFGVRGEPARFLLHRAIRIVPPYWFFTTLMVAATFLASGQVRKTVVAPAQLIASYAFIPWPRIADGKLNPLLSQGWTLNYEAFFYVAFAAALCLRRGLRLLAVAFVLLVACHPLVPPSLFVLDFYTNPIILEFLAGIAIATIYLRGVRLPLWGSLVVALASVVVFLSHFVLGSVLTAERALLLGVPATLLAASLILAPEPAAQGRFRRFLQKGGDASYTLYLSHTFVVNAVAVAWRRIAPAYPWAGAAVAAAAAIAFALLFYRLAERPVTDALHRRFGLRPPDEAEAVAP